MSKRSSALGIGLILSVIVGLAQAAPPPGETLPTAAYISISSSSDTSSLHAGSDRLNSTISNSSMFGESWPHLWQDHRAWILAIEKYLHGDRELPRPLNHHQCRFGHWLESNGQGRHGHQATLQSILPLHHKVHAIAAELPERHIQGDNAGAIEGFDQLLALRDQMQRHLDELINQTANV